MGFEVGKPLCRRALGAKGEVVVLLAGSDLELLGLAEAERPAGSMGPQGSRSWGLWLWYLSELRLCGLRALKACLQGGPRSGEAGGEER